MSRTCLGRVSDVSRRCLGHVSDVSLLLPMRELEPLPQPRVEAEIHRLEGTCRGHVADVPRQPASREAGDKRTP